MQSRVLEGKEAGESVRGDVAAKAGGGGMRAVEDASLLALKTEKGRG